MLCSVWCNLIDEFRWKVWILIGQNVICTLKAFMSLSLCEVQEKLFMFSCRVNWSTYLSMHCLSRTLTILLIWNFRILVRWMSCSDGTESLVFWPNLLPWLQLLWSVSAVILGCVNCLSNSGSDFNYRWTVQLQ